MTRIRRQILGLTGGIGSGKSTVAARFALLGAFILDADAVSRALLDIGGTCYDVVIQSFGQQIVREDGTINRKKVADIVFNDKNKRMLLNAILHPAVCTKLITEAKSIVQTCPNQLVILDVPLLFECGMQRDTDGSILVYADDEKRIARICARDGCTPHEALLRMNAQMPQEEKRKLADFILDNSGTMASLLRQADALFSELMADLR
ncbi:MAG: dephospho-CoA kinase [Clostridia bacterium]